MEPIFRVAKIWFAAVHDGVKQATVGIGDLLGDFVRLIQVVVPKQHQRPHQFAFMWRKLYGCNQWFQNLVNFHNGFSA